MRRDAGTIEWVRDDASLARLATDIAAGPLALDAEGDSLHHYPEKVCLVQVSFAQRDVLIDPLADLDMRLLEPVLGNPGVRKILHGADYDLRVLQRDFGLRLRGLFDTMIAARLVGERTFGLSALLSKHFGLELDKKFQRADWSRRPLTPEMEAYAAMDTRYLEDLASRLDARLDELGRSDWAAEEFARLEAVRWSEGVGPEVFRRVKGSNGLGRRALAVLKELFELREREARRRDRPPFRIMRDEQLVRLAREAPRSRADLHGVAESWRKGRGARDLLAAVARAMERAEEELPEVRPRARRRGAAGKGGRRWTRLRRERDLLARRLDLEPSLLGTRSALEDALERIGRGGDPAGSEDLRRWQLELLRPALERAAG